MPRLQDSIELRNTLIPNRLFRAPLLESAGNGPDAVDIFIDELEPCASSGTGLIIQGASIVRDGSGCAAPNMTRVHDRDFVLELGRLTEKIHEHGGKIFIQLGHGGLRSRETWHGKYRDKDLQQLAVSPLPEPLKWAARLGLLSYNLNVLSNSEVYELAADFGRSASYAQEAGYDGIHLSAANMSIIQQFLSPFYNQRDDEFGGSLRNRIRFLSVVHEEIRDRTDGQLPIITKVPVETPSPRFVWDHLTVEDGIEMAVELESIGYDALVPVKTSVFWDMSIIRGEYPSKAWSNERYAEGLNEALGGRVKSSLVSFLNWIQSRSTDFEGPWNEDYFERVNEEVDIPVLAVGGIRKREEMDRILSSRKADLVGMARPFYAEPKIASRLLDDSKNGEVLCGSCNNCTVPQVVGERGRCRTPSVMKRKAEYERQGIYD